MASVPGASVIKPAASGQGAPGRREYLHEDRVARFLDHKLWLRLASLLRGHRAWAGSALGLLLAAEILPLFQPRLLKAIIDGPVRRGDTRALLRDCLGFAGLVVLGGVLEYAKGLLSQSLGLKIVHELRVEVFARVARFRMDFFHRTPVGRLMTRLGNDIDSISNMFTEGLVDLLGALLLIAYAIAFMFALDWRLATASLLVLPAMVLVTAAFRDKVRKINTVIRHWVAELNSNMQESLSGLPILQTFGKVGERFAEFDAANRACRDAWLKNVRYYSWFFPAISGLTDLSLVCLFFAGAYLFHGGAVSLGTLVAFSWYTGMFFRPLRELSDKVTALQGALAAGERVFTLYDTRAELPDGEIVSVDGPATLAFREVGFAYEEGQPVLRDVSFEVREGETVALVGATGSGKSTVIALCNRFYLPDSGRILLAGRDLSAYRETALRSALGLISQDVALFAESVAFNIALSPDYDLSRVEEACRRAHIHDFIRGLKDGYATRLSERGENLSSGQRQLLAFARALYHNPRILLMDEATSSVDTETEALIQAAMDQVTRKTTSVIVAHRLSTIQKANRILVFHKGAIREAGTHAELLRLGGIYSKLYQMQSFDADLERI